jgi:hypothetical protein
VSSLSGISGDHWVAASAGTGPLFHAGDVAYARVTDDDHVTVFSVQEVRGTVTRASTVDGGATWTIATLTSPDRSTGITVVGWGGESDVTNLGPVYQGPIVVSQGPAATFLQGVGVIGTTGGDADRNFDLAVVGPGAPISIGVSVQLTPLLAAGPDGRLYVVDIGRQTFTAYDIVDHRAAVAVGLVTATCSTIEFSEDNASCGDVTLRLGPPATEPSWTRYADSLDDHPNIVFGGPTPPIDQQAPGQLLTFSDRHTIWFVPLTGQGATGVATYTALVGDENGHPWTAVVPGTLAAYDQATGTVYTFDSVTLGELDAFAVTPPATS